MAQVTERNLDSDDDGTTASTQQPDVEIAAETMDEASEEVPPSSEDDVERVRVLQYTRSDLLI